ncbi:MAG: SAM-dependent methyltransferase [Prevotella sp.]|nr:SAM-dependent methyltransferase [Prevotella sp.]
MRNQESIDFVRENREGDVRQLALKGAQAKNVDIAWALDQISGWQSACTKLPEWAAADGIIYPPHLSMEQCSSEQTAKYKAKVTATLRPPSNSPEGERSLIDLTGGFGVDFSYMARGFQKVIYVERNPELCEIARHNFPLLDLENAEIVCEDGVEYLKTITPPPSPPKGGGLLIYLDPARRDIHGKKTYAISDCTPDVVALKDLLLEKANIVMVKLSPMLDWHKAVEELGEVQEVHIVSVDNECKELLLVLRGASGKDQETRRTRVCCVNLQSHGGIEEFDFDNTSLSSNHSSPIGEVRRGLYLYEPNASLMKAGCFDELAERFGVNPIASNSHLFVSESLKKDFPGRIFQITAVSSMNKKALRENLLGINKANIAVRNFPLSVAELRKRLKLADGGDIYLFATTTAEKEHLLLFSKKV